MSTGAWVTVWVLLVMLLVLLFLLLRRWRTTLKYTLKHLRVIPSFRQLAPIPFTHKTLPPPLDLPLIHLFNILLLLQVQILGKQRLKPFQIIL